ncbi:MAG: type II secretion system protein [Lentisphaeria bacterium]|nr:type II secretion system protein [Lentisphaeria bacterium]
MIPGKPVRNHFTLPEALVVIAVLGVLAVVFLMPMMGDRHRTPYRVKCMANLKGIGQAVALYTDCGATNLEALDADFFGVLLDANLLVEDLTECPTSSMTGVGTGDYETAPAAVLKVPEEGGTAPPAWLVRDRWANGPKDPGGDNNGHGKGEFNFLMNDMNFVGRAEDYAALEKKREELRKTASQSVTPVTDPLSSNKP